MGPITWTEFKETVEHQMAEKNIPHYAVLVYVDWNSDMGLMPYPQFVTDEPGGKRFIITED